MLLDSAVVYFSRGGNSMNVMYLIKKENDENEYHLPRKKRSLLIRRREEKGKFYI